jgi:hypothetical protein
VLAVVLLLAGCAAGLLTGCAAGPVAGAGGPRAGAPPTPAAPAAPTVVDPAPVGPAQPGEPGASATPGCPRPATVTVHDPGELTAALARPAPGAVIELADGSYPGGFTASARADPAHPIVLCGGRGAELDGDGQPFALHLDGAAHWLLVGFAVRGGQQGVLIDGGRGDVLDGLAITHADEQALHLRADSTDNVVRGTVVSDTGLERPETGVGIEVGSPAAEWGHYTGGRPDASDRNLIEHVTVSRTTAAPLDIREGTTGGTVWESSFAGPSEQALAWVSVKGNGWRIVGNSGRRSAQDGFAVDQGLAGWGLDNEFEKNSAEVDGPGYGINVSTNQDRTRVSCDNEAEGAAKGLTNVGCG